MVAWAGTVNGLLPLAESLDTVSFAPGVKWNVAGDVPVTGHVLAAIPNRGLKANDSGGRLQFDPLTGAPKQGSPTLLDPRLVDSSTRRMR